jgi:GNAT superfamily N-acetyltransferase
MTVPELRERMKTWLASDYRAVLFLIGGEPVAYGLYREDPEGVYLRQFFVRRDKRKKGIGSEAVSILNQYVWPRQKRLTVEVLCRNSAGVRFWRAMGYKDYSLCLEVMPEKPGIEQGGGLQ